MSLNQLEFENEIYNWMSSDLDDMNDIDNIIDKNNDNNISYVRWLTYANNKQI